MRILAHYGQLLREQKALYPTMSQSKYIIFMKVHFSICHQLMTYIKIVILVFGPAFRQEFLRRMTHSCFDETHNRMEYFFKSLPSKTINEEATISQMWEHEDLPLFLLENGSVSLKYTL